MTISRYQVLEPAKAGAPQRARDLETAQTVLLRETGPLGPTRFAASLSRARGAIRISHPALVTLFDVITIEEDRLLLAYEYVQAQSIRQVVGGTPFNPRRAAELVSEIADTVAELHARDLVHGAITADTVIITMKGKAKLDRLADPSLELPDDANTETDLQALVALMRQLTWGAGASLPVLDAILEHDDGAAMGSAAMLAASLRAVAKS